MLCRWHISAEKKTVFYLSWSFIFYLPQIAQIFYDLRSLVFIFHRWHEFHELICVYLWNLWGEYDKLMLFYYPISEGYESDACDEAEEDVGDEATDVAMLEHL